MNSPAEGLVKSTARSWLRSPIFLSWVAFLFLFAWPDFYVKAASIIIGPMLSMIASFLTYRSSGWSRRMILPLLNLALWLLMWWLVLFHAFLERPQWG